MEKPKNFKGNDFELWCCAVSDYCRGDRAEKIAVIPVSKQIEIVFPLKDKPINSKGNNTFPPSYYWNNVAGSGTPSFNSNRENGARKHAGRDLYGIANQTEIVAMCDGVVLANNEFYNKTFEITILHITSSGRKFIARYGEVAQSSIRVNSKVTKGEVIAKVGKLNPAAINYGKVTNMLHLEIYSGAEGYNVTKPLTDRINGGKYRRR